MLLLAPREQGPSFCYSRRHAPLPAHPGRCTKAPHRLPPARLIRAGRSTSADWGPWQHNRYAPYGASTQVTGAGDNSQQHTGRENDGTGLYYYRNRYYLPECSRWISEDPIGIAGGMNLYAYVGGNPISFRDPMGFDRWGNDPSLNYHDCPVTARVLGGNPATIGHQGGFPNTAVGAGTAAIDPAQWGGNPAIRPYIGDIRGRRTDNGAPLWDGVSEVIGGAPPSGCTGNVRDCLRQLNPGSVIIELPSGTDLGTLGVTVTMPIQAACPSP